MTPDQLAALRKRYRELQDTADRITEEQDEIKRRIRTLGTGFRHDFTPTEYIHVQPNRRFDVDKAAAMLPSDDLRALCRADGYDAKKVRKMLPPAIQDMCMVEIGDPKVIIR